MFADSHRELPISFRKFYGVHKKRDASILKLYGSQNVSHDSGGKCAKADEALAGTVRMFAGADEKLSPSVRGGVYQKEQPVLYSMNTPATPTNPPLLSRKQVCFLLSDPTRWALMVEMSKGEALPIFELARRLGRSRDVIAKHLAVLRKLGVAVVGFGHLYSMPPTLRPAPGVTTLDFGHCVVRLDVPE